MITTRWAWQRLAALAAIPALGLAGCTGSAGDLPDTGGTEHADAVQVALLDPGNYPTKPRPPLGEAGSAGLGRLVEGRRLADYIVVPVDVDASLTGPMPLVTLPIDSAKTLSRIFPVRGRQGIDGLPFVAGFATARNGSAGTLFNVVLRFSTASDARAAAAEMVASNGHFSASPTGPRTPARPIDIPHHDDTQAVIGAGADSEVLGYTAHGPYVLGQRAISPHGAAGAARLIATTLDKQKPLIDQFSPTPPDQLAALPLDPTGLLARSLPPPPQLPSTTFGYYGPHGALHFQADPVASDAIFKSAGVRTVAMGMAGVYETPDPAEAKRVAAVFADSMTSLGYKPTAGIRGMDSAQCLTKPGAESAGALWPQFYCVSTANKYAIEATSEHQTDVQQQLSAQYLMLADS